MRVSTRRLQFVAALCSLSLSLAVAATGRADEEGSPQSEAYWPQWRGPLGTGVAPKGDPPIEWSEQKNVRWKKQIEGQGHSTPVIWGDRIFATTAIPYGEAMEPRYSDAPGAHDNLPVTHRHKFAVMAIDRTTGETVWQRTVRDELPHEAGHYTASLASNSPVTDGEHVFAHFGSHGLYCLDFDGKIVWQAEWGPMQSKHGHGEGSSPALFGDTLIINWDHEGESFVVALDSANGHERWKVPRDEVTSWATPIVVEQEGVAQVVVCGTDRVRGYDLASGRVIWECGGLSANIVATPVAADGVLFAASSYDTRAMLAIRLQDARGDVTETGHVLWSRTHRTPYVPSPLLLGDSLYFLRHYQGILSRVDKRTGTDTHGPFRLAGIRNVYASPVAVLGQGESPARVYVTDLNGTTLVISHEDQPRVLGQNRLEDGFSASAAIAGREIYLRGDESLYCIAAD